MTQEILDLKKQIENVQHRVDEIHRLLNGNGKLGIVGMVLVMWRAQAWIIGLCGVVVGAVLTRILG